MILVLSRLIAFASNGRINLVQSQFILMLEANHHVPIVYHHFINDNRYSVGTTPRISLVNKFADLIVPKNCQNFSHLLITLYYESDLFIS